MPASTYAKQANAILGIRGSGKTYTGTKAGEELLDASIPIVVFDPVGVTIYQLDHAGKTVIFTHSPVDIRQETRF